MREKTVGPSESRIMHHIFAQLKLRFPNDLWERRNVVAIAVDDRFIRANKKGTADLSGCRFGKYVELEVKQPGKVQSEAQHARQKAVQRAGGIYAVVTCLNEALAIVESIG